MKINKSFILFNNNNKLSNWAYIISNTLNEFRMVK